MVSHVVKIINSIIDIDSIVYGYSQPDAFMALINKAAIAAELRSQLRAESASNKR